MLAAATLNYLPLLLVLSPSQGTPVAWRPQITQYSLIKHWISSNQEGM